MMAWRRRGVALILAVVGLVICSIVVISAPRMSVPSHALTSNLPGIAPDGGEIAFTSGRSGHDEIYIIRADGSDSRQLTSGTKENFSPIWSPDGTKIVFYQISFFPPVDEPIPPAAVPPISIHVMNADGSDQRKVTPEDKRGFGGLSWSPDGTRLVIECPPEASSDGNGEICVLNIDGTGLQRLLPSNLLGFSPAWSPDGRWIAFRSQPAEGSFPLGIDLVSPDGGQIRTVKAYADSPDPPVWSPDGTKLAYTLGNGGTKIVVADVDGSDSRDFDTGDRSPSNPSWSPDGNTLLFLTSSLGQAFSGLSAINADGTGLRDIAPADDDIAWAIWSSDGQAIAVVRSSPEPSLATSTGVAQRIRLEVLRLDGTASRTLSEETVASEVDALIDGPSSWQPLATAPGS